MKKITDKSFVYVSAEKTKEPGYLAKRFKEIAEKQKQIKTNVIKRTFK